MAADRYPLTWPAGWKRTPKEQRRRARFLSISKSYVPGIEGGESQERTSRNELSVYAAVKRLEQELRLLGATAEMLSTNVETRLDGTPRSDRKPPSDPGAACYFKLEDKDQVLACDRWDRVADNIAALAAHIDALRRIERYGVGTLAQAFAGYKALPPGPDDWWLVLGIPSTSTIDQVEEKFRDLARAAHPDGGGTHDDMAKLTAARQAARRALVRT